MDLRQPLLLYLGSQLLGSDLDRLKSDFRDFLGKDPLGSAIGTVLVGGLLFYEAERRENPKVQTLNDALMYVSTSLSVGYSDIFPKTEKGKLIAAALQTLGPAISSQALDPPHIAMNKYEDDSLDMQRRMLDKLDAILTELERQRPKAP
ncbi:MAG: two pore domain potassium channel family protein [Polyangiaceae bacterium]|nr:two pore domain potassium channel family protein [Polyangiaceae bacterium]